MCHMQNVAHMVMQHVQVLRGYKLVHFANKVDSK